jgi:glutamine---fructose-6-phosphate transaminase (isomerizing)
VSGGTGSKPTEEFMQPDFSIVEGAYLQDILSQPCALKKTLESLSATKALQQLAAKLRKGHFHSVVLTGMGSSLHALHPIHIALVQAGFSARMAETSELLHYQSRSFDRKTLIVAVSQSGRSAEMIRLLKTNRRRAAILGVTNTADSPLAKHSDAVVLTHAGVEYSVSCKTYLAGLVALDLVGDVLCGNYTPRTRKELDAAVPAVANYLADWKSHVRFVAEALAPARYLFLVGRGRSLAAVETGALTIKESDHFHAEGMSSAAFRHGPYDMLGPETFVLVFAGDGKTIALNERLRDDIRAQGGTAEFVGESSPDAPFRLAKAPRRVLPLLEILPVQMITLALATLAGREPGRFQFATKITATE